MISLAVVGTFGQSEFYTGAYKVYIRYVIGCGGNPWLIKILQGCMYGAHKVHIRCIMAVEGTLDKSELCNGANRVHQGACKVRVGCM